MNTYNGYIYNIINISKGYPCIVFITLKIK